MQAILFALISYFTWGSGVFFEAIAARRMNPYSLTFWSFFLSFIVLSLYVPFEISSLAGLSWDIFILNYALALFGILLGTLLYYEALRIENRALVGTIASSFPIVTVILSIIFLGERISSVQTIAMLLVFTGLFLASFNIDQIKSKKFVFSKGILFAIITMLVWGLYFTFIKIPIDRIGWFFPNYISLSTFPLLFLYFFKIKGKKLEKLTHNNVFIPLIASTILVRIAEFSYNLGISKGLVAVVAPIARANPTLFVILAFLVFKDPIKKQQIIGIILSLLGVVALSIFSN